VLVHLSIQALKSAEISQGRLVWVGQAVWPCVFALASTDDGYRAVDRSLFVRVMRPDERLWATDLALRSGAAAAVIADGSGLNLAGTRRLQLASEAGGALCLLARPPWEQSLLSAASTRWLVRFCSSSVATRRWTVELLRCKGMQPAAESMGCATSGGLWILERHHATRTVVVVPGILDRPDSAKTRAMPIRRTA
jgi:hypothetical protein